MITVAYAPSDAGLGQKLEQDLKASGQSLAQTVQAGREHLLVVVLSAEGAVNAHVNDQMIAALENHQHVIPIFAQRTPLPRLIDNLDPLDFSTGYPLDVLVERIAYFSHPDAPRPLTTLIPSVRAANRRAGIVLIGIVLGVFVLALIMVGSGAVRWPEEEYDVVNTEAMSTIESIVVPTLEGFMPRSTEAAAEFESTVRAMPSPLRPLIRASATAQAGQ